MIRFFLLVFFNTLLLSSQIASVKNINGEVKAKRLDKNIVLKLGSTINNGDTLITKRNSNVGIVFHDGTILTLGENSILTIDEYLFNPLKKQFKFNLELLKGQSAFESGKIGKLSPQSVRFKIPEGIIGIRGTKFYVEVKE